MAVELLLWKGGDISYDFSRKISLEKIFAMKIVTITISNYR